MHCDYDTLVAEALRLYPSHHFARSMSVNRIWSADGETELARYPYSRVRFVNTYDAAAFINRGELINTGLIAECVR